MCNLLVDFYVLGIFGGVGVGVMFGLLVGLLVIGVDGLVFFGVFGVMFIVFGLVYGDGSWM